ncbi:MAG: peptidase S11 [Xanthomonadales bacterium]|nr:serine hydrolase [Gammaproteobacteria bacterium]MBT8074360.1 serine hydrolase [Gammaproteobacteria bacterium]NNK05213.1 peptidase S11 [Xanthomonadales bacterium]NNL00454.1 peptidase S11 [Xanthomonadales bacterium]
MYLIKAVFYAAAVLIAAAQPLSSQASNFTGLEGKPALRSASALVVNAEGNVIYGKDIDTVRPIASITKLMSAMVVIDSGLDLDEKITVTRADRDLIQLTGSRLEFGASLSRREMIMLAIMSSENRAATALGRNYPDGMAGFVEQMNRKAAQLGMDNSHFTDPAGLMVENTASARDLMKMVRAAQGYELIRRASTTTRIEVRPYAKRGPLVYGNTNRLLKNKSWEIGLSKTGYINEAGRCLVMQANIEGERVSIVLLNSFGKLTPFGDSNRLRKWMLAKSS